MKQNVEFPKKVKHSFIFFQLGLIATMLAVLFVLEFNFELKPKHTSVIEAPPTYMLHVPTDFRVIPESKPIVSKPVAKIPKFKNQINATTKEVPKEKTTPNESAVPSETVNPIESLNPIESPIKSVKPIIAPENTLLNVEELPMFPACKGLSRTEQMKCFEEQMAKEVARNTVYPEGDLEQNKQGRAIISFIIDETGRIVEVKAVQNKYATAAMQKAAEAAVRKVSKLTPAKQGGKQVRIKYTIPVAFRIQ